MRPRGVSFRRTDALVLLLYSALIFFLSSQPVPSPIQSVTVPHADKFFHAAEYGLLGFLWLRALRRAGGMGSGVAAPWLAFVFCLIYAVSDEWLQRQVSYRTSSLGDLAADGIGAALAIGICRYFSHSKRDSSTPGGAVRY
ncbi:MAG: VanZ family protein [Nitrospinota bacterium]